MSAAAYWIRVDGLSLSEAVTWSPPTWETLADGGCGQASFTLGGSRLSQVRTVRAGAQAEIMLGMTPVHAGEVMDFDPNTGDVAIAGPASVSSRFLALDGSNNVTRDTAVAGDQAKVRGWNVTARSGTFGVGSGTDATPQTVAQVHDQYAVEHGLRWGVDARRRRFMRPDPTIPKWLITPGSIALAGTIEGAISHYVVLFFDGSSSQKTTVAHPKAHTMARREEPLDLTGRGTIGLLTAQTIALGAHELASAKPWASGATITNEQIRAIGDTPAALADVRGGDMVRIMSTVPASGQSAMWLDAVIGKTRHTAGEKVIYVEPTNTAPRSVADVIAAA